MHGLEVVGQSIHSSSGDRNTTDVILSGSKINGDDQGYNNFKEDNERLIEEDIVEDDENIQWLVTSNPIVTSVLQALKIYHVSPGFYSRRAA